MENSNLLQKFIQDAIEEDILQVGDITSLATIPSEQIGLAQFYVKEACVLAGVEMAKLIAKQIDAELSIKFSHEDGANIHTYTCIGQIEGKVQSILLAERTMLNCMQRMSGIATKVNHLVALIKPFPAKILDTRKTTPNFRIAEKWAVKIGGGVNHRFGLYDMVLIKDNHIKACGSIENALLKTFNYCKEQKLQIPVIVEVKDEIEFNAASKFDFVSRILLDNMTPNEVKKIVLMNQSKKILEASGGINSENIIDYASTGVDFISIGDITHHVQSIDISLKIK